ncbi:MAG TPA: diguanylate cyclase [Desulfobacteraceae bacterium]|nr:diguanylate cyclase [Desulfobacteraceae bacterium]
MKLCFPVKTDKGLESNIFGHFGSAPFFVVFNTEDTSLFTIDNQDLGHIHGQCNPMKALDGQVVDAVIVGGIGAGAIRGLNNKGITVYRAGDGNIKANIELFRDKKLSEMTMAHTCGGHGDACGHSHGETPEKTGGPWTVIKS